MELVNFNVRIPEEWKIKLKAIADKKSEEDGVLYSSQDLIRMAIKEKYFNSKVDF